MPMFMAQFAYTPEAWAALIHAPQDRAAASDALLRHFGGRLIGLHYTPGAEYDGFADRKSTRLNSSHRPLSRMPSSA